MKRLSLALIAVLVVVWLLLNETLALPQVALGVVLAVVLALASAPLRQISPHVRRPLTAARLLGTVVLDVARSNVHVARIVLGLTRGREIRSGFIDVPLDLHDPFGLAVLAAIVTATPGTVWAGFDGGRLTLHVLDLADEDAWIRMIKQRYERPLVEIFQ